MTASAGETSIPAPVTLSVTGVDVALMWRAVQQQRHGVNEPWMFWLGIAMFVLNIPMVTAHSGRFTAWVSLACGICFIALSLNKSGKSDGTLRPTYLVFDADGLTIDVTFAPPSGRRYAWRSIRRIDDVGDSFVLVPKFGKRVVLPKRAFPDRGAEAWAFFAAHGVAGRMLRLQPVTTRA